MRVLRLAAVALVLAVAPGASTASERPADPLLAADPREILPAPVLEVPGLEGEPIAMSLREVVLTTIAQNLDIQIVLRDRAVAAEQVLREFGIYDPELGASVTRQRVDRQNRNFDAVTYQNITTTEASISQRTPFGTRLSVTATDERTRDLNDTGMFGIESAVNPSYDSSIGVRATQPLLKNFGPLVNNAQIRISRRRLDQANLRYAEEVQNRLAEVMSAYWNLDFAIRNLQVQRQAQESADEFLRITRRRVDVGALPRLSLLQAEAQAAARETFVADAEAQVIDAQDRLLELMNWGTTDWRTGWNRPIVPTDIPSYTDELDLDDVVIAEAARENRLDFLRDQIELEVSGINRDVSRRQRLPELNAFGGYTFSGLEDDRGDSWQTTADGTYTGYHYGLELRYPLLNREARAAYRQALEQVDKAVLQLESRELQIIRDVRASTRRLRTSLRQIESTSRQVEFDVEKLSQELRRLDVGDRTVFDVLEFQEDLAASRASQARAVADYQIGLVELARASGVLLELQGILIAEEEGPRGWAYDFERTGGQPEATDQIDWVQLLEGLRGANAANPHVEDAPEE